MYSPKPTLAPNAAATPKKIFGTLGGFDLHLEAARRSGDIVLSLDGIPTAVTHVDTKDLAQGDSGRGLVRRLEGHLNRIDTLLDQRRNAAHEHRSRADQTRRLLGAPFDRASELAAAKQRLSHVEKDLAELHRPALAPCEVADRSTPPSDPTGSQTPRPSAGPAATPLDATRTSASQPRGRDL